MSIANAAHLRSRLRAASEAGFSLLEVSVSLFLVVIMALVVERTLESTRKAEVYLSAVRKATERGHQLTYEIRELVTASRRLFSNDDEGRGYLAALDISDNPVMPGARMPVVDPLGRLGPDADGTPLTGNLLLFVGETDATAAIADPDGPVIRSIDTYRFVCCYPRRAGRKVVVNDINSPTAVDMVVWQSEEFPDYKQIMAIADPTERSNVVIDLVDRFGVTMAWDPAGAVDDSFYALDASGNIAVAPEADPLIKEDPDVSQGGRLVYANVQLAATDNADAKRKALFSTDDPSHWTPNGFEVKIVGASGSRKVWMHLVVEVQADGGRVAVQPCTIIASVKDL
ncbi:MAG: hypothetical protein O2894_05695 [Planctomycetota bacterium]|nr:hypothetical protein [Planctomycetota bacterium]